MRNEHSIGILKGRGSCLREHRQQIGSSNDVQAIIRVSTACVILHNMLANLGDSWDEMFREVDPVDVSVAENVVGNDMECASAFREVVKSYAIEKEIAPLSDSKEDCGGCLGKREAENGVGEMNNRPAKKLETGADHVMQDEGDVCGEGVKGHLMIDGGWREVGEEEVSAIASAVKLLV
ncbi:hypothetical protein OROMI_020249 [Orobanche minor]